MILTGEVRPFIIAVYIFFKSVEILSMSLI